MDQINSISGISASEEIKAIEPTDENFFYEENFNSMLREELAKKNAEKKEHKNDANNSKKNKKNHDEDFNENHNDSHSSNYDEKLDNSKNSSIINNLGSHDDCEENYTRHKTVFITLTPKKDTVIPIHEDKKFIEKLSKIMVSISKKIKLLFIFVFQYF